MDPIRTVVSMCAVLVSLQMICGASAWADENNGTQVGRAGPSETRLIEAQRAATEKRREWMREKLTAQLRDKSKIAQLNAQLDALDDQQVDVAAVRLLEQLDKRSSRESMNRAAAELARATATRDALRRRVATRRSSPAGFFPVITVLPQGASMTASAVVSPDRRHVRVNVNPFFSSIGPVDTFNFYTGETYRQPQFNPQPDEPPPVAPRYDGFRTRNDRAPQR